LLKAMPTARLLMFRDTLTGAVQARIRGQFSQRGIGEERLDLRQSWDISTFLKLFDEIDVTLDAFPCTGGVTTCESLWMGVPVLSLCGSRPASRNSAAILNRLGLSDWVVQSPEQYVAASMRLTADLGRLAQLRCELRELVSKHLCDAGSFTRALEEAYRTMWRRWCAKQPASISRPS
jgi:protein O-GlcNAc transferase